MLIAWREVQHQTVNSRSNVQVPVIDLSQDEDAAAAQVRAACLKTGFFYGGGVYTHSNTTV